MPAEIGILLVHGIGTQKRGETVVGIGEPLYRALKKWIEAAVPAGGRKSVELVESVLDPADASEPAHARLRIATEGDARSHEWIMAECHWAESFPPPEPRAVTIWIMQILPWICVTFVARRLRMAAAATGAAIKATPRRWLEAVRQAASVLTAIVMAPLIGPLVVALELFLVVLLIAGLIPLRVVRDFVARTNAVLSSILGDSFIYASSAIRQQAVVSKIRADLKWLEATWGCKHLVILAHSQGAALSYLSIRQDFPSRLRLLVTFGSGLLKLHQLGAERLRLGISIFTVFVPFGGILLLLVVAAWLDLYTPPAGTEHNLWVSLALSLFYLVLALVTGAQEHTDEITHQIPEFSRRGLKWIDLYASMDPVPNGPLFLSGETVPESIEVCNGSSPISDHTSYTRNVDEFLLQVVAAIGRHGGTELPIAELTPLDRGLQLLAGKLRRIRIDSRRVDGFLLTAALIAVLVHPGAINAIGVQLNTWLAAACGWVDVGSCPKWPPAAIGLAVVVLGYVVLGMCVDALASIWESMTVDGIYDRSAAVYLIDPNLAFFRHAIAATALSGAALLHYSETFSWFEAIHNLLPEASRPASVRFLQAMIIGLLAALVLSFVDMARAFPLAKQADLSTVKRVES